MYVPCLATFFGQVANFIANSDAFTLRGRVGARDRAGLEWRHERRRPLRVAPDGERGRDAARPIERRQRAAHPQQRRLGELLVGGCADIYGEQRLRGHPAALHGRGLVDRRLQLDHGWRKRVPPAGGTWLHRRPRQQPPDLHGWNRPDDPTETLDDLKGTGGVSPGPPAVNSCQACETVDILKVSRFNETSKVWISKMPDGLQRLMYLTVIDPSDPTFNGDDVPVLDCSRNSSGVCGTDASGANWVAYSSPGQPDVPVATVSSWSLSGNQAAVTASPALGINAGDDFTVTGVPDGALNGPWTAGSVVGGTTLKYADLQKSTYDITAATLTTDAAHTAATATIMVQQQPKQQVGDPLTVNTGDPAFDGSTAYPITGTTATTITYSPPLSKPAITGAEADSSCDCATINAVNDLQPGDEVVVTSPDPTYATPAGQTATVLSTPAPNGSQFSIAPPGINFVSYRVSNSGNNVILTTNADLIRASLSTSQTHVTVTSAANPWLNVTDLKIANLNAPLGTITYPNPVKPLHKTETGPDTIVVTITNEPASNPGGTVTVAKETRASLAGLGLKATAPAFIAATTCPSPGTCGTVSSSVAAPVASTGSVTVHGYGSAEIPRMHYLSDSDLDPGGFLPAGTYYGGVCIGLAGGGCNSQKCHDAPKSKRPSRIRPHAATAHRVRQRLAADDRVPRLRPADPARGRDADRLRGDAGDRRHARRAGERRGARGRPRL